MHIYCIYICIYNILEKKYDIGDDLPQQPWDILPWCPYIMIDIFGSINERKLHI